MSASVAPGRTEVVIGCPGSQHVFKIVDGRYIRWRCKQRKCLRKAEFAFGRPMKVFHFCDIVTGELTAFDDYEELTHVVE